MGNSNNSKTRKTSASSSSDAESSSSEADLPKAANPPKTLKTKSMKRLQHQLNGKTRDFIKSNWDTAKMWNIGERIFRRMLFKEKSWKTVLEAIVKAKRKAKNDPFGWEVEAKRFEDFLGMIVSQLDADLDLVKLHCFNWGATYAQWSDLGLKADFWYDLGEAMLNESFCMEHSSLSAASSLNAWTALANLVSNQCRNGYYAALQDRRRNSLNPNGSRHSSPGLETRSGSFGSLGLKPGMLHNKQLSKSANYLYKADN